MEYEFDFPDCSQCGGKPGVINYLSNKIIYVSYQCGHSQEYVVSLIPKTEAKHGPTIKKD